MSVGYSLVNVSKRQIISFAHIPASTVRELAGNPVAAAISTWYLLQNQGNAIAFVSDTYDDWPFPTGGRDDLSEYEDVTDTIVNSLVEAGILADEGIAWADPAEPDRVYIRALRNRWMDG